MSVKHEVVAIDNYCRKCHHLFHGGYSVCHTWGCTCRGGKIQQFKVRRKRDEDANT